MPEMVRKWLFSSLLSGVWLLAPFFSLSVVLLSSSSASAWSGALPKCTGTPSLATIWQNIDTDEPGFKIYDNNYHKSFVIGKYSGDDSNYRITLALNAEGVSTSLVFQQSGDTKYTSLTGRASSGGTNMPHNVRYVVDSSGDIVSRSGLANTTVDEYGWTCISYVSDNATYSSTWTGPEDYTKAPPPSLEPETCDTLDFVCWFGSFTSNVIDSMQDFWNGFVSIFTTFSMFIADIFIPGDDNIFVNAFDSINTYLRSKLGFLLFPLDFFAALFYELSQSWSNSSTCLGNPYPSFCRIFIPKLLGDADLTIYFGVLEQYAPPLWDMAKYLMRIGLVIMMMFMYRQKYLEVVQS